MFFLEQGTGQNNKLYIIQYIQLNRTIYILLNGIPRSQTHGYLLYADYQFTLRGSALRK